MALVDRAQPKSEYFDEYTLLYDHITMLQDVERMHAYHEAIKQNAERHFKGKAVLDVGCGTGILAIWAAQAGARKVYAVEATGVAKHAEKMVRAQKRGYEEEGTRSRSQLVRRENARKLMIKLYNMSMMTQWILTAMIFQ